MLGLLKEEETKTTRRGLRMGNTWLNPGRAAARNITSGIVAWNGDIVSSFDAAGLY